MAAACRSAGPGAEGPRRPRAESGRNRTSEPESALKLVIDASALLDGALGRDRGAWSLLLAAAATSELELVGPELLWSESVSALHELSWRRSLEPAEAAEARALIIGAPIGLRRPEGLRTRAWGIAERMGWAKTYDAEYCAVAELLGCELVTTDRRLRAAGERLGYVRTLGEAAARLVEHS